MKKKKKKKWQTNGGQLSLCKKIKNLRRQFEHFLVFMANRKKNIRTKMLFRTPGKKLQTSWTYRIKLHSIELFLLIHMNPFFK